MGSNKKITEQSNAMFFEDSTKKIAASLVTSLRADIKKDFEKELASKDTLLNQYIAQVKELSEKLDQAKEDLKKVTNQKSKEDIGQFLINKITTVDSLINTCQFLFAPTNILVPGLSEHDQSIYFLPYLWCKYYNNRKELEIIFNQMHLTDSDISVKNFNLKDLILPVDWSKEKLIDEIKENLQYVWINGWSADWANHTAIYSRCRSSNASLTPSKIHFPWHFIMQSPYINDNEVIELFAQSILDKSFKMIHSSNLGEALDKWLEVCSTESVVSLAKRIDWKDTSINSRIRDKLIEYLLAHDVRNFNNYPIEFLTRSQLLFGGNLHGYWTIDRFKALFHHAEEKSYLSKSDLTTIVSKYLSELPSDEDKLTVVKLLSNVK